MPTIQVSTKEEVNKAIYEICKVIQSVCKEEDKRTTASILPSLVQSAAELIKASYPFMD